MQSRAVQSVVTEAMTKTVGVICILLLLAGCNVPEVSPPTAPGLEIVGADQGWVQVRITDVPSLGYELQWGDVGTSYGVSVVIPSNELYEHFYQAVEGVASGEQIPTQYEITLTNDESQTVAQESILIESVDCHLSLVSLNSRQATVRYWGRFGIEYSISWGDSHADHLMVSTQSATGLVSHTYAAAGTYSLGMEEIWAPRQTFFTVTVE